MPTGGAGQAPPRRDTALSPSRERRENISCMGLPELPEKVPRRPPRRLSDYVQGQLALHQALEEVQEAYGRYRRKHPQPPQQRPSPPRSAGPGHPSAPHAPRLEPLDGAARRRLAALLNSQQDELSRRNVELEQYRSQLPSRPGSAPNPGSRPVLLARPAGRAWLEQRLAQVAAGSAEAAEEKRKEEGDEGEEEEEWEEEEEEESSDDSFEDSEEEGTSDLGWAYGAWQEEWFGGLGGARTVAASTVKMSKRQVGAGRVACPSLPPRGTCRRPGCGLPATAARGMYCCERCLIGHGHCPDCSGEGLVNNKRWTWLQASRGATVGSGDAAYTVTAGASGGAAVANVAIDCGKQDWVLTDIRFVTGFGIADEVAVDQMMETGKWAGMCWYVALDEGKAHQPWGKPQTFEAPRDPQTVRVVLDADQGTVKFAVDGQELQVGLVGAVGQDYSLHPVVMLGAGGRAVFRHKMSSRPVRFMREAADRARGPEHASAAKKKGGSFNISATTVKEEYVEDVDEDSGEDEWGDGQGSGAALAALKWDGPTQSAMSMETTGTGTSSSEGVVFNVCCNLAQHIVVTSVTVVLREGTQSLRVYSRAVPHGEARMVNRKVSRHKRLWKQAAHPVQAKKGPVTVHLTPPLIVAPGSKRPLMLHCSGTGMLQLGEKVDKCIDNEVLCIPAATAVERDRSIDGKYRNAFNFHGAVEYACLTPEQVMQYGPQLVSSFDSAREPTGSPDLLAAPSGALGWFNSSMSCRKHHTKFAARRQIKAPAEATQPTQADHPVLGAGAVPICLTPPGCALNSAVVRRPGPNDALWLLYDHTCRGLYAYGARRRQYHKVLLGLKGVAAALGAARGATAEPASVWPNVDAPAPAPAKPGPKRAKGKKGGGNKGAALAPQAPPAAAAPAATARRESAPGVGRRESVPGRRESVPGGRRASSAGRRTSQPPLPPPSPTAVLVQQVRALEADGGFAVAAGVPAGGTVLLATLGTSEVPAAGDVVTALRMQQRHPDSVLEPLVRRHGARIAEELKTLMGRVGDDGEEQVRLVADPEAIKRLISPVDDDLLRRCGDPCMLVEDDEDDGDPKETGMAQCAARMPLQVIFRDGVLYTVPGACVVGRGDVNPAEAALRASVAYGIPFVDPTFVPGPSGLIPHKKMKKSSEMYKRLAAEDSALLRPLPWMRPGDFCHGATAMLYVNEICADDISQGELADCWLLCAISAVAEAGAFVKRLFVGTDEARAQGAYQIRLCLDGWWQKVIVDNYFPCAGPAAPAFATNRIEPNEIWVSVIEKAFAKHRGSYSDLQEGDPGHALEDITGFPTQRLPWQDPGLFNEVYAAHEQGFLVTVQTPTEAQCGAAGGRGYPEVDGYKAIGLNPGHAYTLLDTRRFEEGREKPLQLCQLRNPWGDSRRWFGRWGPESELWSENPDVARQLARGASTPGTFWMAWSDMVKWFYGGAVCLIRPQWHEVRLATGFGKGGVPAQIIEIVVDALAEAPSDATVPCYLGVHQRQVPASSERGYHGVRVSCVNEVTAQEDAKGAEDDDKPTKWVIPTGGRSHEGNFAEARDVHLVCELKPGSRNLIVARAAPGCKPFSAVLSVQTPATSGLLTVRRPQSKLLRSVAGARNDHVFELDVEASPPQLARVQLNRRCATRERIDLDEDMPAHDHW